MKEKNTRMGSHILASEASRGYLAAKAANSRKRKCTDTVGAFLFSSLTVNGDSKKHCTSISIYNYIVECVGKDEIKGGHKGRFLSQMDLTNGKKNSIMYSAFYTFKASCSHSM